MFLKTQVNCLVKCPILGSVFAFPHEQMFLTPRWSCVLGACHHSRRREEFAGGREYFQVEWISSFSMTLTSGFSIHGGPWLESTSPFRFESDNFWTPQFHLHFLVFYKKELCLYFFSPTPLTCMSVCQCRFIIFKNSLLIILHSFYSFWYLDVLIAPLVARGASSTSILCVLLTSSGSTGLAEGCLWFYVCQFGQGSI